MVTDLIGEVSAIARLFGGVVPLAPQTYRPCLAFRDALRDERDIASWYYSRPADGVGVVAAVARLIAIDVESPKKHEGCADGEVTLAELQEMVGALPATREHRSKSGGRHLIFAVPEGCPIRSAQGTVRGAELVAPSLDVVAGHALIRMPPTAGYSVLVNAPIAPLPVPWLVALGDPPQSATVTPIYDAPSVRSRRYALAGLEAEAAIVAGTTTGRSGGLNRAAWKLARLVPTISEDEIANALMTAAEANGSVKKRGRRACLCIVRGGLRAGARKVGAR